jgi:hypothetical protein
VGGRGLSRQLAEPVPAQIQPLQRAQPPERRGELRHLQAEVAQRKRAQRRAEGRGGRRQRQAMPTEGRGGSGRVADAGVLHAAR